MQKALRPPALVVQANGFGFIISWAAKEVGTDVTFREWLTPENLEDLDPASFLQIRECNRRQLESLSRTLSRCGIQFKMPK